MPRNQDDLDLDFDEMDDAPARPGMLTGTLVAIGAATLLIFAGVMWYAYDSGRDQAEEGEIPIIRAEQGDTKVKPGNPGGAQFAHQDKTVYDKIDGTEAGVEQLLPGSEEPKEKPEIIRPAAEEELPADGQPKVVRVAPPEDGATPVPPTGAPEVTAPDIPDPMGRESAQPSGESAAAAPLPEVTSIPPVNAPPEVTALPGDDATATEQGPEQSAALTEPAREETPLKPAPSPAPAGPGFALQLGAFRSTEAANAGWKLLSGRHGGILAGLDHFVTEADLGEKGRFFRLQAGPFPDRPAANAKCDELKNAGASCIIVAR